MKANRTRDDKEWQAKKEKLRPPRLDKAFEDLSDLEKNLLLKRVAVRLGLIPDSPDKKARAKKKK